MPKWKTRGIPDIAGRGDVILADSTADLERLEAEMESTELAKYLSVSKPRRRMTEIIVFGVDSNLPDAEVVPAILEQSEILEGASLVLRTSFPGKLSRNIVLTADQ